MAALIYTEQALADLERFIDFLAGTDQADALTTVELIEEAISLLARHPLVGRPAGRDLRELVISRGRSGYVALYSFEEAEDTILILALRHQREAGYAQGA